MHTLAGRTAVITGASRGLGPHLARAFAREGMNLVLAARAAAELERAATEVRALGVRAITVLTDVGRREDLEALVEAARREFGAIDLLVNNAGLEAMAAYERLAPEQIEQVIRINLTAPMLLTRLALPGMLERKSGHVLNMASMAAKATPAYGAVYSATKAGVLAFTKSLRAEFHGTGVSASALIPGLVRDAGFFERQMRDTGARAPALVGTVTPEAVARAAVRAVRRDAPELMVNPTPTCPLTTIAEAFPRFGEWATRALGVTKMYRRIVEGRGAG